MSCVIDTVDQTYFLCCEEIYSAGANNTIYNFGETTVTGAQNSGAGAVIEAAFFCDTGDKTYNFQKAYCLPPDQGPFVDLNTLVSPDFEDLPAITIAQAAGNQIPDGGFRYYLGGGSGNDSIIGSKCNDFIRGKAGNDTIKAAAGNDLVNPGAGNDLIRLGRGNDTAYFTPDALQGGDQDVIQDFGSNGTDKLAFKGKPGEFNFAGIGTNTLQVTFNGKVTTIVSGDKAFALTDINFIG